MKPVAQILDDIETLVDALGDAGDKYMQARKDAVRAEVTYEQAVAAERIKLLDEYRSAGERLPGEDVRNATIHSRIPKDVWADYLMAEAKVEALHRWIKTRESMLSGLQSQLAHLRVELANA